MNRNLPRRSSAQREKQKTLLPLANRLLLLLIICGVFALVILTFYPEWKKLSQMRHKLHQEQEELVRLEKNIAHKERELFLLQHDKEYFELIARDRLDLMKPNETIFRLGPSREQIKKD